MKVEELIIDGFKSYATRTVISGWDPQFNAITGLNGSGKSNILDAICFVLGIASMSTVRASNLQDLIYKRGQAGVTKASVTIVFDNDEIAKSPIGFENCSKISVTRQIILGGSSKYLINGHKAQQQTVLNLFQSVQLNINNPNFLIMQGKITKVLNMKPPEILSLIEEAAGTRTFEERKIKAQNTMAKKESKLVEIRTLLKEEIEPKLEKLRNEKRTFLEYQQIQTDLEKLTRVITAHDYIQYSKRFDDHSNLLNERNMTLSNLNSESSKLEEEILILNTDLASVKKEREKELKKDGRMKELESLENQISDEITRMKTSRDITLENIKEETKNLNDREKKLEYLKQNLQNNDDVFRSHEKEFNSAKAKFSALKEEYNKKEELLSTLSTGVSAKGNADGGYMAQLKDVKNKLNESKNTIEKSRMKIVHLTKQLEVDKLKFDQAQEEVEGLSNEAQKYKQEIEAKEKSLIDIGYDAQEITELRKTEHELQMKINKLNDESNYIRRDVGNIEFSYSDPYPGFDRSQVKGIAAQLFNLKDVHLNKSLALQVCAGGRLFNVVVESSDVASNLLEKGKLRKRVTIIPLDKINSRVINNSTVEHARQLRPQKVELALNLIDFENELSKAMEYIFGSTFICADPDTAKAVTFDPKIRARSITIEGDVYDPEGNLSGGSRKNTSSLLVSMQKLNKLNKVIEDLTGQSSQIRERLRHFETLDSQTKNLRNEIKLRKHELSLLERKIDVNPASAILKEFQYNEKSVQELQALVVEEEANIENFKREIQVIEDDMSEFSSNKGSKLKKLQKEVDTLRDQLVKQESEINERSERFQTSQIESEQQKIEVDNINTSITNSKNALSGLENSLAHINEKIDKATEDFNKCKAELDDEKANMLGLDEEISELVDIMKTKNEQLNNVKLSIQKLNHELEKSSSANYHLRDRLDSLIEEHEWVTNQSVLESILSQYPNINMEEYHEQQTVLEEKFQNMRRRVNPNIMSMIDNVEKKEASLKQMIKTIEKDKSKIVNTVDKLNSYKRDTLNATYKKVSVDFGNVFADLLPGSFTKLVPVDENDVTKGLEVKVKLGTVWKESLVELSGGQRSLVALSLIMALLQFKPAPMYILDEVDAALDLSHTQNIGHLIKTRFKGSQFIVVSLKEGMFTNANTVFRTRFQDGTSVVSVM